VDYIGRSLVTDALRDWRRDLEREGTPSSLRDLARSEGAVLNLADAHPGGLAQLFAGRPTLVSSLFRDPEGSAAALAIARVAQEHVAAARMAAGVATGGLAVGTIEWSDGPLRREMPLLVRPVTFEPSRGSDTQVTLHQAVALNPVVAAELRARLPERSFEETVRATLAGPQFDPRPLWDEIRGLTDVFGEDVSVEEVLLLGSFDDPEQRLLDDLDESEHLIASNAVLAAVAGDRTIRDELIDPLPAPPHGDRDPFAERGLGDLDDVQFAALDVVATGRSIFIQMPPGADAIGTVVAIAADGAASGRVVAVVGGTGRAIEAVANALDAAGAGDVYVSGATDRWNSVARSRLLESMTSSAPPLDEVALREVGERLVSARTVFRERVEELHRKRTPWGVSAYRAVEEIARLTSVAEPPSTPIRISETAAVYILERGIEVVAAAAALEYEARVAAEIQGALFAEETVGGGSPDPAPSPEPKASAKEEDDIAPPETEPPRRWWQGTILDEERGAEMDEVLATFLLRHLPRLREAAAEASEEVGVDEAATLTEWVDQVRVFDEIRTTLETFSPAVFQGALNDLIAATAPEGSSLTATLPKREIKASRRRAEALLRPGRPTEGLHEALVEAHHRAIRWRGHCGGGGWPSVPDELDSYGRRIAEAGPLWSRLAPVVEAVTGRVHLADQPWKVLQATLESLTETRRLPLEEAEVRDTKEHLVGLGFETLYDEMASRSVPPAAAAVEIEFAWWASAFEAILAEAPRLTEYGVIGRAAEQFLTCDREFAELRVQPLMRAIGERRRLAVAQRQDDARDLFATLVEGGDGPFRDQWARFPELVGALRPVVLCTAEQASEIIPPARVVDTIVLLGIESTSFAELVPAIARSSQVVAMGDAHAATCGAIPGLKEVLPDLVLHAHPQPRDARVTAVLSEYGYGDELESLPAAGIEGSLEVVSVDAVSTALPGSIGVETSQAEVTATCVEVAAKRGQDRLIIAANDTHAGRIREALEDWDGGADRDVPVLTLGRAAGAEADLVVLSLGYGSDTRGEYPESLGILSTSLGVRTLRQALVASRRDVVVVTALSPDYLGWAAKQGQTGHGVEALADLVALAGVGPPTPGSEEGDWLLGDLARRLRDGGLVVRQRYGTGGDIIPLVVGTVEDRPTVAIITDEVPPRPGTSLRDQVRWQRTRLEALGWVVVPLFTLDVFMDPEAAANQIRGVLGAPPGAHEPEPEPEPGPEPEPDPEPEPGPGDVLPSRSVDDTDVGWGEVGGPSRDEEIQRDRPPHW